MGRVFKPRLRRRGVEQLGEIDIEFKIVDEYTVKVNKIKHGRILTPEIQIFQQKRNVRLGLAADGFNPFGNLSQSYNMWPVILTTYNLSSWLCMKETSFMVTLLIPGPKSLGTDIDVYLRPLIDDLKKLWKLKSVKTIEVVTGKEFKMRVMFLWTINDFLARSSLSREFGLRLRVKWLQHAPEAICQVLVLGAEVELLEPGFELDDQEWVEIETFSFERLWDKLYGLETSMEDVEGVCAAATFMVQKEEM
nr:hypothetical protein [Tanacetum cinerariifolium]